MHWQWLGRMDIMLLDAARQFRRAGGRGSNAMRRRLRAAFAGPLPPPLPANGIGARILDGVAGRGAYRLPAVELLGDDAVRRLAQAAVELPSGFDRMEGDGILALDPDIYRAGLAPAMLDLAEAWLGGACLYLGASLKRETVGSVAAGTRRWHLDIEDARMLRVLVYLTPVPAGGGPLEYLTPADTRTACAGLHYRSGYVADAALARLVPESAWLTVEGEAGDAVVFDGTSVFHRAQAPVVADRLSITYAYTSRKPYELRLSARLAAAARRDLVTVLDARAAACLPPARLF